MDEATPGDPTSGDGGWWATDPSGRFPRRYWGGNIWTNRVALDSGVEAIDTTPVGLLPPPGALDAGMAQSNPYRNLPPPPIPTPGPTSPTLGWQPLAGTTTRSPWRPALGPATLVLLSIAFVVLMVGLWGAPWIDTGGTSADLRATRPELRDLYADVEDAGMDLGIPAALRWWLDWAADGALVVLVALAAGAAARLVTWPVVAIASALAVAWHVAYHLEQLSDMDWDLATLGVGAWATAAGLLLVAGAAWTADPEGWPGPSHSDRPRSS